MTLRRLFLIAAAAIAIAAGSISFGLPGRADVGVEQTAAACAICGDGVCAKSCENKYSCPRDCGGGGSNTRTSTSTGQTR